MKPSEIKKEIYLTEKKIEEQKALIQGLQNEVRECYLIIERSNSYTEREAAFSRGKERKNEQRIAERKLLKLEQIKKNFISMLPENYDKNPFDL